jgi:alpha-ketoglutarate-dependent taurine dioxygenase
MDVPQLKLSPAQVGGLTSSTDAVADLAHEISEMLRTAPHFVVVKADPREDRAALTMRIADVIADSGPSGPGEFGGSGEEAKKVSFNVVAIKPTRPRGQVKGTAYSRTNEPLNLHTDSTFQDRPHELVAFQFVRAAAGGGDSLMLPVKSVTDALDDEMKRILAEPNFPFSEKTYPLLWERNGAPHMRYYRAQIEFSCENGANIGARERSAMDTLDAVLCRDEIRYQFHAEPGDTVFMHNTKVLHGRTGFAADSDRLMYRVRAFATCLD